MKHLFILSFLVLTTISKANTFFVTSNADSGPNTLRQAILDAASNGNNSKDSIYFNFSNTTRSGRTIVIFSSLPNLTSNLIIDGTTQVGDSIGISNAKVIIEQNSFLGTNPFTFLKIENARDIEIYGLYFYNSWFDYFTPTVNITALSFENCKNLFIGKGKKGNYFRGMSNWLTSKNLDTTRCSDSIYIMGNILGNDEKGEIPGPTSLSLTRYVARNGFDFLNVTNLTIGGKNDNEGNLVYAFNHKIEFSKRKECGYFNCINNKFSLASTGQLDTKGSSGNATSLYLFSNYSDCLFTLINNGFNGTMQINQLTKFLTIKGNKFLVPMFLSSGSERLSINQCTGSGIVGGLLEEDKNVFYTNNFNFNFYYTSSPQMRAAFRVLNSPKIKIQQNSTYCNSYFGTSIQVNSSVSFVPYVRIDTTNINFVKGKATPNCVIEVFLDDDCPACEGKTFLGKTTSGSDSIWSFNGNFTGVVVATATTVDGSSSGYSIPELLDNKVIIKNPSCGFKNGYIKGVEALGYTRVEWRHLYQSLKDSVVSNSLDALNLGPGEYYLHAWLGNSCRGEYYRVTLTDDVTPKIDTSFYSIVQPSCGKNNGSIKNLVSRNELYSKLYWKNEFGQKFVPVISGRSISLINAYPGKYKLYIIDTIVGCADSTNWISLINQTGPSINYDSMKITSSTCGLKNGSIEKLQIINSLGTGYFLWRDSTGKQVSVSQSLLNAPSGSYYLIYKDNNACDTLTSNIITINSLGRINLDTSLINIKPSNCLVASGSISGLLLNGADTIKWIDVVSSHLVGSQVVLNGQKSGNYQLRLSNRYGCTFNSSVYFIPQANFDTINVKKYTKKEASCNFDNGSIVINNFTKDSSKYTFRWFKTSDNTLIANYFNAYNLKADKYNLVATDSNGCNSKIFDIEINQTGKPKIDTSLIIIKNDSCSQKSGSINNLNTIGGGSQIYWNWYDSNNNLIGNQSILKNIPAGSYSLKVTDNYNCKDSILNFKVFNKDFLLNDPILFADSVLRNIQNVIIKVSNLNNYTYNLFDSINALTPLSTGISGIFNLNPINRNTVYYVNGRVGSCKTNMISIMVSVFDESKVSLPNVFSPNNDGINDFWNLKIQGLIFFKSITVFDRYGKQVFYSSNANFNWDGKYKGIPLPTGTYYWVLNIDEQLNKTKTSSGSVTILN